MTQLIDVLVADDDAQMRRLLQLALTRSGCAVRTVANGAELIDAVMQQTPDVVITDMRMPGMTGLAALNRLRASHPELPCVLITAFGDHDVHRRARSLGARSMDKPLDPDQLAHLVGELAARSST
jgi:two-component system nitrogen regulation response regulator GlnG